MAPWIFTPSLLNLPNFKNSSILVVNTGSILIASPLKSFLPTPVGIVHSPLVKSPRKFNLNYDRFKRDLDFTCNDCKQGRL